MKKLSICIMTTFLMLSFNPSLLKAGNGNNPTMVDSMKAIEAEKANVMIIRLKEIKAMDKSKLTSDEKLKLRNEVSTIKTDLKASGRGVYLSFGAVIIIILLLIILL